MPGGTRRRRSGVAGGVLAPDAPAAACGEESLALRGMSRGIAAGRLGEVVLGFNETSDPALSPSMPPELPRAYSRYRQLGRGLGYVANYGPAIWGFLKGLAQ